MAGVAASSLLITSLQSKYSCKINKITLITLWMLAYIFNETLQPVLHDSIPWSDNFPTILAAMFYKNEKVEKNCYRWKKNTEEGY